MSSTTVATVREVSLSQVVQAEESISLELDPKRVDKLRSTLDGLPAYRQSQGMTGDTLAWAKAKSSVPGASATYELTPRESLPPEVRHQLESRGCSATFTLSLFRNRVQIGCSAKLQRTIKVREGQAPPPATEEEKELSRVAGKLLRPAMTRCFNELNAKTVFDEMRIKMENHATLKNRVNQSYVSNARCFEAMAVGRYNR